MARERFTIEIEVGASDDEPIVITAGASAARAAAALAELGISFRRVINRAGQTSVQDERGGDLRLTADWQTIDGGRVRLGSDPAAAAVRAQQILAPELVQDIRGDAGPTTAIRSTLPVGDGQQFRIGRTREENELRINDANVARHHAVIACQNGQYVLRDLGSGPGTKVNDIPLAAPRTLSDGDRIALGGTVLVFADYAASLRAMQKNATSGLYSQMIPTPAVPAGKPPVAPLPSHPWALLDHAGPAAVSGAGSRGDFLPAGRADESDITPLRPPSRKADDGRRAIWLFAIAVVVMLVLAGLLATAWFGR